jgi:hypothetical protein
MSREDVIGWQNLINARLDHKIIFSPPSLDSNTIAAEPGDWRLSLLMPEFPHPVEIAAWLHACKTIHSLLIADCYFARLGFLDGKEGMIFHFL